MVDISALRRGTAPVAVGVKVGDKEFLVDPSDEELETKEHIVVATSDSRLSRKEQAIVDIVVVVDICCCVHVHNFHLFCRLFYLCFVVGVVELEVHLCGSEWKLQ